MNQLKIIEQKLLYQILLKENFLDLKDIQLCLTSLKQELVYVDRLALM